MRSFHCLAMLLFLSGVCTSLTASPLPQNPPATQAQPGSSQEQSAPSAEEPLSPEVEARLINEVRHKLVMLPYYNVFDNLEFSINGRTVTLNGQVVQAVTKSGAEDAVKHIEGVEKVVNNIEILPPSGMDERVRREVYNSIYSFGPLFKYGTMAVPPIHIIVRNAHITLDGVVDSESDKNYAGVRANMVPGTFGVINNLRVIKSDQPEKKKKKK
jgi:hyperosmotically inducible protein